MHWHRHQPNIAELECDANKSLLELFKTSKLSHSCRKFKGGSAVENACEQQIRVEYRYMEGECFPSASSISKNRRSTNII